MTAGTWCCRRTARAAALPTRSRATASICFTELIVVVLLIRKSRRPPCGGQSDGSAPPRVRADAALIGAATARRTVMRRGHRLRRESSREGRGGSRRLEAEPGVALAQPADDRQR